MRIMQKMILCHVTPFKVGAIQHLTPPERLTCGQTLEDILNDEEDFSASNNAHITEKLPNDVIVSNVKEL